MIRLTSQVIRAIHKYKADFPILFAEYEQYKKEIKNKNKESGTTLSIVRHSWCPLSDMASQEYLLLIQHYLIVKKAPSTNRKVVITTHNGGKYVGFFEDNQWWYLSNGNKLKEKGIVIKWEKNYF